MLLYVLCVGVWAKLPKQIPSVEINNVKSESEYYLSVTSGTL